MTGADIANSVSAIFGFAGDVITTVSSNPLMLMFACSGVVGIAIGVVRKLIGRY